MQEARISMTGTARRAAAAVLLAGAVGGSVVSAQASGQAASPPQGAALRADADGALPAPAEWRCDRIAPEYRFHLNDGGSPESWRYAGKTFRTIDPEPSTYTWSDWLRWYRAACDPAALQAVDAASGTTPSLPLVIGGVVAGVGVIGLLGSGSTSDSPG